MFVCFIYFQLNIRRISFEEGHVVETLEEAKEALWKLINRGSSMQRAEIKVGLYFSKKKKKSWIVFSFPIMRRDE
jgi:hypothetical protein